ncbi:MAG: amidohydrolase family protein [Chloroflexota bacterium]
MIDDLGFFDCNARLGPVPVPGVGGWVDRDQLLAEMEYFGIAETLVVSTYAKEHLADSGNERLMADTAGFPTLHPCWVLFPAYPGIDGPEEDRIDRMLARGVRAARLYPNPTNEILDESENPRQYVLHEAVVGPLLTALAARRVPLLLDLDQVRWEEVYDLCTRYPRLPIVLTAVHYSHKRSLFAGFARFPNLRAEISGYHVHLGLEEVCAEFGPERMLFGTRIPSFTPASAVAMVRYADVGPEAQRKIAGDNLRQLLGQVEV